MLKQLTTALIVLTGLVLLLGCASTKATSQAVDPSSIEMMVLSDHAITPAMDAFQQVAQDDMGDYMDRQLIHALKKAGYKTNLIESDTHFSVEKNRYLLAVSIKDYHLGSPVARALLGCGAGARSMKIQYTLFKNPMTAKATWEDEVATAQDPHHLPEILSQRLLQQLELELAK